MIKMNKVIRSIKTLILLTFITFCINLSGGIISVYAATLGTETTIAGPIKTIEKFQSALLEIMKNAENTDIKQRYKYLEPTVKKTFHFPLMVQIASGGSWHKATNSERLKLADSFQRMSIMTLAALFSGYNGEIFKVASKSEGPQKTTLVSTELIKTDKSKISIVYVTRMFKSGWRIIDVIVDKGISELLVRRSEYQQTLRNKGISGLIKILDDKADEISLR